MNANKQDAGGLPELPVAVAWCEPSNPFRDDAFAWAGIGKCNYHTDPLYTADQMRAYGELCRAAPAGGDVAAERCGAPNDGRTCYPECGCDTEQDCEYGTKPVSAPAGSGEVDEDIDGLCCSLEFMAKHSDSVGFNSDAECLRTAAALLRKLQQGADYVLVPRVPTDEMETAHRMYGDTSDWWQAVIAASQGQEGGK